MFLFRLELGYVYLPDGRLFPVDEVGLNLWNIGERGNPPTDYFFTFKAGTFLPNWSSECFNCWNLIKQPNELGRCKSTWSNRRSSTSAGNGRRKSWNACARSKWTERPAGAFRSSCTAIWAAARKKWSRKIRNGLVPSIKAKCPCDFSSNKVVMFYLELYFHLSVEKSQNLNSDNDTKFI